jgi:hypothetical protein
MKLLVIGSGMMGSAAAYDMARQDARRLRHSRRQRSQARQRSCRPRQPHHRGKKVRAVALDASKEKEAARLMKGHDGALSAVPYRLNLGLAKAAISAGCHFRRSGRQQHDRPRGTGARQSKPKKKTWASLPIAAFRPAWRRFLEENWSAASTAAPMRSSSTSEACPKDPCLRFIISSCFP